MSFSISMPALIILMALALCLVMVAMGAVLGRRNRSKATVAATTALVPQITPEPAPGFSMSEIVDAIGTLLAAQEQRRQDDQSALRSDLAALRGDVEWLASERMIEQAIEMCREGAPTQDISDSLGLSSDAIRTIRLLRAH
nr:hypothetical protein [Paracoccus saliphilus]